VTESKNRVNQLMSSIANWLVEDAKQRTAG